MGYFSSQYLFANLTGSATGIEQREGSGDVAAPGEAPRRGGGAGVVARVQEGLNGGGLGVWLRRGGEGWGGGRRRCAAAVLGWLWWGSGGGERGREKKEERGGVGVARGLGVVFVSGWGWLRVVVARWWGAVV
nr:glycine-rich RNA-binding protein GRP2A-like [Arachis hypogaea]